MPLVGIIGGSGIQSLLEGTEARAVHTPYGPPSDAAAVGRLAGVEVGLEAAKV